VKKLLLIAGVVGAALWLGAAPAVANPASDDDGASIAKKKRDGGTRDEEREED